PDHPEVATALNNLAQLYLVNGDPARAEPLIRRALAVFEKLLGPEHQFVALSLNNLAELYRERGDIARAEPLYRRALAVYEKALGPDHPEVAAVLNNLAVLYQAEGDYARAEPLIRRALAVRENAFGPGHRLVALSLNNLADIYHGEGALGRAEPLYRRALAVYEKALGPDHPEVATALNNLASLFYAKGEYTLAEPLYTRSLAINEKARGPDHSVIAASLSNLAVMYEAKGDLTQAVQFQSRAQEVHEHILSLVLAVGSERQKLVYLATLTGATGAAISLHARSAPSDPEALRLSLTTILRRKGRGLDAMSEQVASLRRRLDPQARALLDQLSAAQTQLSALTLGDPGKTPPQEHRDAAARLEAEVERLQDAVSRRSAEFRVQTQPVTIEQVRAAIPPGAALVEVFYYRPFDPKAKTPTGRFGPGRYVAYVMRKEGEPLWVDLGEAAAVDADAARLLAALKCPPRAFGNNRKCPPTAEVKRLGRTLDERVMRPVRRLLGETRQVFVSPDGALNLVPFVALVDENDKYLVESYSLTYLTSGRDLLRLQLDSESKQPPLVFADPLFGQEGAQGGTPSPRAEAPPPRRSSDLLTVSFQRLAGAAGEAKAIGTILPGARVLTEDKATEQVLKQASSPRVLHVATHGFFLPDQPRAAATPRDLKLGSAVEGQRVLGRAENPLLRSGL
ncbi:MAG TPA: tetratricopeptide repeat protein, partial [Pyrinomonadaceae bacterium]